MHKPTGCEYRCDRNCKHLIVALQRMINRAGNMPETFCQTEQDRLCRLRSNHAFDCSFEQLQPELLLSLYDLLTDCADGYAKLMRSSGERAKTSDSFDRTQSVEMHVSETIHIKKLYPAT